MDQFDLEDLCQAIGGNRDYQAMRLGFESKTDHRFRRMRARKLNAYEADQMACRAGLHPASVWPHWWPQDDEVTRMFVDIWTEGRGHAQTSPRELRRASAIGTLRLVEQGVY